MDKNATPFQNRRAQYALANVLSREIRRIAEVLLQRIYERTRLALMISMASSFLAMIYLAAAPPEPQL